MYFTVNTTFVNYLDKFPNLTQCLEFLIMRNKTTFEQTLPIFLNICKFDPILLTKNTPKAENIKVNKNYIWDMLEIDWKEVTLTFNDNKINLPRVVTIKLQDKSKVRHLMKREPLLFHLILKQGITWFT